MFLPYAWLHRLGTLSTPKLIAIISFFAQLYFFVPVMTPCLQGMGLSLAQIAAMQTTLMVTQLVMEIPSGVLADLIGHRRSVQFALVMAVSGDVAVAHQQRGDCLHRDRRSRARMAGGNLASDDVRGPRRGHHCRYGPDPPARG